MTVSILLYGYEICTNVINKLQLQASESKFILAVKACVKAVRI